MGCPTGNRNRVVLAEAGICTDYGVLSGRRARSHPFERILRLSPEAPALVTATREVKRRLKARSRWRIESERIAREAELQDTEREKRHACLESRYDRPSVVGRTSFIQTQQNTPLGRTPLKKENGGKEGHRKPATTRLLLPRRRDGSTEEGFGKGGGGIVRREGL